jgi:hypothetical protein
MRVMIDHALIQLRRDLARLNDLVYLGDQPELLALSEAARASDDLDEWLNEAVGLPFPDGSELPPEELAAGLQAVWAKADATLARPGPAPVRSPFDVSVVHARRYTQQDVLRATPGLRFQMLHGLRARLAAASAGDLEGALGVLFGQVDPGPERVVWGQKLGLVHLRLRVAGDPVDAPKEFEGWFFDRHVEDEACYWPSPRARLSDGRLFVAGSVIFTGVELRQGEVEVDARRGVPLAQTLAQRLGELAAGVDVELLREPEPGESGYFGSEVHAYQVSEM